MLNICENKVIVKIRKKIKRHQETNENQGCNNWFYIGGYNRPFLANFDKFLKLGGMNFFHRYRFVAVSGRFWI